jgi:hypothetical protein
MTCTEAREALLSADLAEVRAVTGPLYDHLAACATCRHDASRIVAAYDTLMHHVVRPSPDAARAAARRAIAEGRLLARRRRRQLVAPLLIAAAGVAIVLLVPRDRAAHAPAGAVAVADPALPPLVEAAGSRVAVITTRRPDITVVWQF